MPPSFRMLRHIEIKYPTREPESFYGQVIDLCCMIAVIGSVGSRHRDSYVTRVIYLFSFGHRAVPLKLKSPGGFGKIDARSTA